MWLRHRVLPAWAQQAGAVLVLLLVKGEDRLVAASAWRANASHRRRYLEGMDR